MKKYGILVLLILSLPCVGYIDPLVGISFADLNFQFDRTMHEVSVAVKPYVWGSDYLALLNTIQHATENDSIDPKLKEYLDVLVKFKNDYKAIPGTLLQNSTNQACNEVLVRCVYALAHQVTIALEQCITHLEQEKSYWLWAQAHPWHYFFSKSPTSWFSGPKQEHYVAEHISSIKHLLTDLYEDYGCIIKQKASFAQCESLEKLCRWAEETLGLFGSIVLYKIPCFKQSETFEDSIYQLSALVDLCDRYIKTLEHRINFLKRPHHITRYWIPYTAVTIGAISAYLYYRNNKHDVDTFIKKDLFDRYPTLIKKKYEETISENYRAFGDLLLDRNRPERPNFDSEMKAVNNIYDGLIEFFDGVEKGAQGTVEDHKPLDVKIDEFKNTSVEPIKVETWAGEAKISNFEQTVKKGIEVAAEMCKYGKLSLDNVNKNMIKEGAGQGKAIIESCREFTLNIIKKIAAGANMTYDLMNKKLSVTIGMLTMVPAAAISAGAVVGSYKTVQKIKHWFTKHDFRIIRSHVSNIHDVLINADTSMTHEQYGRFMYCVHKLHMQAYKNVPYHHRDAFITHLKQLASDTLNIQQKKEMIANMRFTYEFLSPMFVA